MRPSAFPWAPCSWAASVPKGPSRNQGASVAFGSVSVTGSVSVSVSVAGSVSDAGSGFAAAAPSAALSSAWLNGRKVRRALSNARSS